MQVDRREAFLEPRHADPIKFWEIVTSRGPDYEEGCWPTLHKLSGAGAALLMSPRQGETSQHKGIMCGVEGWASRKCLCETVAWATPLGELVSP